MKLEGSQFVAILSDEEKCKSEGASNGGGRSEVYCGKNDTADSLNGLDGRMDAEVIVDDDSAESLKGLDGKMKGEMIVGDDSAESLNELDVC